MYFEPDERVIVKYGVVYKGIDLSDEVGIIQDTNSYITVFFPRLDVEVNMLAYEIEHYPRVETDEYTDWS